MGNRFDNAQLNELVGEQSQRPFLASIGGLRTGQLGELRVDLFVLETFRDVDELECAVRAVRAESGLPIVAQMTTLETGELDADLPAAVVAGRLVEAGASVLGVNCGTGPASMLETIEQLQLSTRVPLAAQPNAGLPREVEGRTMYLSSPDFLASYARRFVRHGVRLVGGCCGTTPAHIRQIASVFAPAS